MCAFCSNGSACQDELTRVVRRLKFLKWLHQQGKLSEFTPEEPALVPAPGWWSRLEPAGVNFAEQDFKTVLAGMRARMTTAAERDCAQAQKEQRDGN